MAKAIKATFPVAPLNSPIQNEQEGMSIDWINWCISVQDFLRLSPFFYNTARGNTAILVAGTVTILNTNISPTSLIRYSPQSSSANAGHISVSIVDGVSFTLTSTNNLDNRTIFYEIMEAQ